MDQVKAQLARIQQQLGQLTASQKMLAASLVAVMVLSLLFWGRYAGNSELEPVLDQTLKGDEISRITAFVRSRGVDAKVVNDRVMVPADRKMELLAALSYEQVIPQDTRAAYDEIIKRINPWESQASSEATRNDAKSGYLAAVIRGMPNVASADVIIDPTNERRIGGLGRQPTAMVKITLRDASAKPEKNLIQAAAAAVAGAQSGLAMKSVSVIVNGATYPVTDKNAAGSFASDDMLALQQQYEHAYAEKVQNSITYISGALVSVTVDLNIKTESSVVTAFDPKTTVSKESQTSSETTETKTDGGSNMEPGMKSNAALTVDTPPQSASAGGNSSTHEKTDTTFDNHVGSSKTESSTPAGKGKVVAAAVSIPRSYIVNIWRALNNSPAPAANFNVAEKGPDEATIQQLLASELPKVRAIVKKCCNLTSDEDVTVEAYTDILPPLAAAGVATASVGGSGMGSLVTSHYKEVGVVVLALVSLFMVSSMVKKGQPEPIIAASAPIEMKGTPTLSGLDDLAGDVAEGEAMLDGMELDEDAVRSQQMVQQVSTMVKENPDAAASLVKRWLNHP